MTDEINMKMFILVSLLFSLTSYSQDSLYNSVNLTTHSLEVVNEPIIEHCLSPDQSGTRSEEVLWREAGYENVEIKNITLDVSAFEVEGYDYPPVTHEFEMDVVLVRDAGWSEDIIRERYSRVKEVFSRCGISLDEIKLVTVDGPVGEVLVFGELPSLSSSNDNPNGRPIAGKVRAVESNGFQDIDNSTETAGIETIQGNITSFNPGEPNAESDYRFGERMPTGDRITNIHVNDVRGNPSTSSPEFIFGEDHPLINTQWIESRVLSDLYAGKRNASACTEAHELGHVLLNEGHYEGEDENIMQLDGYLRSDQFSPEQCEKMKNHELVRSID